MRSKFGAKQFRDEDIQIIVEEVCFLLDGDYRARERNQILDGLEVALDGQDLDGWKRWANMRLGNVMDELFIMGTP